MNKVAILRAVGDGGLQDPASGQYISSKRDTIAPLSGWVENLVNHDQVKVVEVLEGSNWASYQEVLRRNDDGDEAKALEDYRKELPSGDKGAETVRLVADPTELETQEKRGSGRQTPRPADKPKDTDTNKE